MLHYFNAAEFVLFDSDITSLDRLFRPRWRSSLAITIIDAMAQKPVNRTVITYSRLRERF